MVMSQKQIDEMVKDKQAEDEDELEDLPQTGKPAASRKKRKVKPYNFLAPQKYQKEQLKMLDNIFENFVRFIGSQLTSMLRVSCTAKIEGLEEMKFRDYIAQIGDSSLIGIVEVSSPENGFENKEELMLLDRPISFAIMDYMLGGDGSCYNIDREYTEIELSLMQRLFRQFAPKHNNIWSNYAEINRNFQMIETNLRMIQSIPIEETIILLKIDLIIKDFHGEMHLCIPASTMDCFLSVFHNKAPKPLKAGEEHEREIRKNAIMGSLKNSDLLVTGVLGTTEIHVQELLDLQPGDIFLLNDAGKDSSVQLQVEGEPWFKGKIGVHKRNYAVKITEALIQK